MIIMVYGSDPFLGARVPTAVNLIITEACEGRMQLALFKAIECNSTWL